MESMLTISAWRRSAQSRASRLLPEAVGPVRITALRNVSDVMVGLQRTGATLPRGRAATMPRFETAHDFPFAVAGVFDFLVRTGNRVALAPPGLHMRLVEGPEVLALGA